MKIVTIYTDGACSSNPGPGGWAAILIHGEKKKEICGGEKDTTNNRMEMLAVINGLKALKVVCKVSVHSDSAYVVNAINNGWIYGWVKNGWKTADKKPVKNQELWEELLALLKKHDVTFVKVKGHADDELNNRCDFLARAEAEKLKVEN
ncbi:MAG TPA: ribonuclease HI [Clostridiales bacterium]|nr:ribonuclease HI [Clostridiales bacterium]